LDERAVRIVGMEWTLNLALLLIGVVFAIEALGLGLGTIHRPGPGFLPFYVAIAFGLVTCFPLLRNILAVKGKKGGDGEKLSVGSILNLTTVVVALFGYVLILARAGYLISTFLLLIFLFRAGGFRKWSLILTIAFVTVSASYLVFSTWLNIRFPKGFLGI